jgi:hypothetical protein
MILFIGTSVQLQPIIIAHNQYSTELRFLDHHGLSPFYFSFYGWPQSQVRVKSQSSYFTTDGQSAISGLRPGFYCHHTVADLLMWSVHSDERTGLPLQLLLALASAVILGSESRGTRDHILLSQIQDSPNLEGQVAVFISPRSRVVQLYPQTLGSLFVTSYD